MEDFSTRLMNKYPSLFYKNELGETECPCGIWVPQGWEKIVDDLCGAIKDYIKGTYRLDGEVTNKMYYLWRIIGKCLDWGHKRFLKFFPKYNKWEYNKPFYSFVEKFRQRSYKCIKYNRVYPPAVKIDQVKEKFAELSFYYSGGDKEVAGMVCFAEYLCRKTCEVSGEEGEICSNGGWYRTLSENTRQQDSYKNYKPLKQTCQQEKETNSAKEQI
jgi:hypothetical protein